MANILSELTSKVLSITKATVKLYSLDINQIRKVIAINKEVHMALVKAYESFDDRGSLEMMSKYNQLAKTKDQYSIDYIPGAMKERYIKKAREKETKRGFGALLSANKEYINILNEIDANLEKLFEEESVTIYNTRMSGIMVFGILRQSDLIGTYSVYLWDHVIKSVAHKQTTPPVRYRAKFLIENMQRVVDIVNDVVNAEGKYSFVTDLMNIKKQQGDLILHAAGSLLPSLSIARLFNSRSMSSLTYGVYFLNVFLWAGEKWDNYQHCRYQRKEEFKAWMETHVALLRLELASKDPNSPEYQHMLKLIDAYDQRIIKYDRDINEYMKEQ